MIIKRIGKYGAEYEETFYFDDGTTEEQIMECLYEWDKQFLEAWFEEDEE